MTGWNAVVVMAPQCTCTPRISTPATLAGVFDVAAVRELFPALSRRVGDDPAVYADGPGGTQVPRSVIDAMAGFLREGGSNLGGPFVTSRESSAAERGARRAVADLVNAERPEEISFGQNMTSLTLSLSRALARTWEPGDQVVCTRLDHDANVWSWKQAADDAGAELVMVDFDVAAGRLEPDRIAEALTPRTRLVAVTHASNALGSVVDVAAVTEAAHAAGALVFVDAVHFAPHGGIDVRAIGCDGLAVSAYKFFGPHTGALYLRHDLSTRLDAVRIRPAPSDPPGKWETGTQSFESLAGVTAAVDYLASLGEGADRRAALDDAMTRIGAHERTLSARFLEGVEALGGVTVHGIDRAEGRTPTFALAVEGRSAAEVASRLGERGIFVWHGHYYAVEVMRSLGVLDTGGLVRIGFVHYNTIEEVDRTVDSLARLVP
jgi:cysteine desulfurase family protein (TIGR01976 family)